MEKRITESSSRAPCGWKHAAMFRDPARACIVGDGGVEGEDMKRGRFAQANIPEEGVGTTRDELLDNVVRCSVEVWCGRHAFGDSWWENQKPPFC